MKSACDVCGNERKTIIDPAYHYTLSGLDNVYLENLQVEYCEQCNDKGPILPRVPHLHKTIAEAIILKPSPLTGREIRFLRKERQSKAKDLAVLLPTDVSTLSRWENEEQTVGPQSDTLMRLLYVRMFEEQEGKKFARPVLSKLSAINREYGIDFNIYIVISENRFTYHYQLKQQAA
jgi:YgiT-type zinc finger domain-containing protein